MPLIAYIHVVRKPEWKKVIRNADDIKVWVFRDLNPNVKYLKKNSLDSLLHWWKLAGLLSGFAEVEKFLFIVPVRGLLIKGKTISLNLVFLSVY